MRIDLLSSAAVVDRAVKFVDRHKDLIDKPGYTDQNSKVIIDDVAES
ncbi:MAG: hypothetical protein ACRD8Z_25205 [Nitrososphaeraceae archaeon]